jgi:hypothetical protein
MYRSIRLGAEVPEHSDAARVREQQKPSGVGEGVDHRRFCLVALCAKSFGSVGDRLQRQFQRAIEDLIALLAETVRLHTATKKIEAEIEVSWIVCIISKESHRRGPQPIRRRLAARNRPSNSLL